MERWAYDQGTEMNGEDVQPSALFDIIAGTGIAGLYAILFARLNLTLGQAVNVHHLLETKLFGTEIWAHCDKEACKTALGAALEDVFNTLEIPESLDSPLECKNHCKGFICVVNDIAISSCRLLRTYKARKSRGSGCTIRQAIHATLADGIHLSSPCINDETFRDAMLGFSNPSSRLMHELMLAFPGWGYGVACIVNLGAGDSGLVGMVDGDNLEQLKKLLQVSTIVAEDIAVQCHHLGPFFFRLSVSHGVQDIDLSAPSSTLSKVLGATYAYTKLADIDVSIDNTVKAIVNRPFIVQVERMSSLAAEDGQALLNAQVEKIHEDVNYMRAHTEISLFREVIGWLKPVDQTGKLRSNIEIRGLDTCQWFVNHFVFHEWSVGQGGLLWFHGAMGTGKTVTSSHVIEILQDRQPNIILAYFYFEFTNPISLSEEALFRSLVAQLSTVDLHVVHAAYEKHSHGTLHPQLETLRSTLNSLVASSQVPIYIVLDALDELPLDTRKSLLRSLRDLPYSSSPSGLHVMVSSRDELDIHQSLRDKGHYELPIDSVLVETDIAVFVNQQLSEKKWSCWPAEDLEMVRVSLNARASGQFRMVACQFELLKNVQTSHQLYEVLRLLPPTLSQTYDRIMSTIPLIARDDAQKLFTFLAFCKEPLLLSELVDLMAVELGNPEDSENLPLYCRKNLFHEPQNIIGLGSAFLTVRLDGFQDPPPIKRFVPAIGTSSTEITVEAATIFLQLSHASVKEYLLSIHGTWFNSDKRLAEDTIARACLGLLLSALFSSQTTKKLEARYSAAFWHEHVRLDCSEQLLSQQRKLFNAVTWIGPPLSPERDLQPKDPYELDLGVLLSPEASVLGGKSEPLIQVNINRVGSDGGFRVEHGIESPLQAAVCLDLVDLTQDLLHASQRIETELDTCLLVAAARSRADTYICCSLLLDHGADPNAGGRTLFGSSPIQLAIELRKWGLIDVLVDRGVKLDRKGFLQDAAFRGDLQMTRYLVLKGASVNMSDPPYGTPLQAAIMHNFGQGSLDIIQFLVDNGTEINAFGMNSNVLANEPRRWSQTALQTAAYYGNLELVQFLVSRGADVNVRNIEGDSALHFAVSVSSAVQLRVQEHRYWIPSGEQTFLWTTQDWEREWAARAAESCLNVSRWLLENGADVNVLGEAGTALHAAVEGGCLEIVQLLVESGADINLGKETWGKPRELAQLKKQGDIVKFLKRMEGE
ncbi:hypothetical protein DL96DRAFT_1617793 [Flagelloscypha sp. PMI_526]|nr:hypothetical protein DL96DRAFT_1617793 [Flagelloscypha sp. PMI_526]